MGRDIPIVMGFPAYGRGLFEDVGIPTFVLLPVGAVFWWGCALPIPPIFAFVWTALVLLNWQALQ